jgi:hypothetical protein
MYCHDEEASDDGGSTEYSEYCDEDTIRAAPVTELIVSSASPSSTALGKRKSPDESGPFDDLSITYKRRTISSSFHFDSVTASSEATLFGSLDTSLAPDDIPRSQEYDGPEPCIIVSPEPLTHSNSIRLPLDSGT